MVSLPTQAAQRNLPASRSPGMLLPLDAEETSPTVYLTYLKVANDSLDHIYECAVEGSAAAREHLRQSTESLGRRADDLKKRR
jgi:hypothetical protein